MANQYTLLTNCFKKMELTNVEYLVLKYAEDERAGREIGNNYYGSHTMSDELAPMKDAQPGVLTTLDDHGIIAPYGHPFRFIVTEKGRLLLRIYELEAS